MFSKYLLVSFCAFCNIFAVSNNTKYFEVLPYIHFKLDANYPKSPWNDQEYNFITYKQHHHSSIKSIIRNFDSFVNLFANTQPTLIVIDNFGGLNFPYFQFPIV